jgi:hypothetical protein
MGFEVASLVFVWTLLAFWEGYMMGRWVVVKNLEDRRKPKLPTREEWVQVMGWGEKDPGWIPRRVLEDMGIDCSPLDRRGDRGKQGTVWFTESQAKRIRDHREFELEADSAKTTAERKVK